MKISNNIIITAVLLLNGYWGTAQVKIGENLQTIDGSSILELESTQRAFVLTRVTQAEMTAIMPLHGALVYNTDAQCVYMFDGGRWESLCNRGGTVTTSAIMPTGNQEGDIWIDPSRNSVSIWNGTDFVLIRRNPYSGSGIPMPLEIADPLAGDIYVDTTSGDLYTYNGSNWLIQGNGVQATNGITETATHVVELGGVLTKPTNLITDRTNTLAIQGLEITDDPSNMVMVLDGPTGVLGTAPISALVQREETVIVAHNGQNQFATPVHITDQKKIDVYRNGIKIDFTVVGSNTIEMAPDAACFQDDEIRIIQLF